MVAGKEEDGAVVPSPIAQLLCHSLPPFALGERVIEKISGAKHCINRIPLGNSKHPVEYLQASPRQTRLVLAETLEALSQMPIRGVQELKNHIVLRRHAITSSASRIRCTRRGA